MSRPVLQPSTKHPITITPTEGRVVVQAGGQVIADSGHALTLQESTYPAVQYIPLADVDEAALRPSAASTYCPFKGDASYYSLETSDGTRLDDVVWTYREPHEAVAEIGGHVAFYADRTQIEVQPAG
jgi:uncharacterized protein (DUF427 family)